MRCLISFVINAPSSSATPPPAVERKWNTLTRFKDFQMTNGSSRGQNLALTGKLCSQPLDSRPRLRVEGKGLSTVAVQRKKGVENAAGLAASLSSTVACSHLRSHSRTHTHTHSHTHTHTLTHSHSPTHTPTHSHAHTLTHPQPRRGTPPGKEGPLFVASKRGPSLSHMFNANAMELQQMLTV